MSTGKRITRKTFQQAGRKGGMATGAVKVRGNTEYYRALGVKAAIARQANRERKDSAKDED